jgi:hypothetical protein
MAAALSLARPDAPLDLELVEAAGLLHDIAKGRPGHEAEGGRVLAGLGFPRLAAIVADHRDIDPAGVRTLAEREVVYLADKLAQGPLRTTVGARFGAKLRLHGHDPAAAAAIRGRMDRALAMAERFEKEAGTTLDRLLGPPEA